MAILQQLRTGISYPVMRTLQVALTAAVCVVAQDKPVEPTPIVIPDPAFTLRGLDLKPQSPHTVVKLNKNSGSGPATGTFAVYGGLPVEVSSLSFSGDGKLLAVGSTPGRVDLWDMDSRRKIRTFDGGSAVSLSMDGRLLANDGKGIESKGMSAPATLLVRNHFVILNEGSTVRMSAEYLIVAMPSFECNRLLTTTVSSEALEQTSDCGLSLRSVRFDVDDLIDFVAQAERNRKP